MAAALVVAGLRAAHGQDARLAERLDSTTRTAVEAAVDSARLAGLPTEPLVLKALEGASKRAPGPRIVSAVRSLARELGNARAALGDASSADELTAGAAALHAGASAAELSALRAAGPRRPLTVPLAVLADLVARGVPADTASSVIRSLTAHGTHDDGFLALRAGVERDIVAGMAPAGAASARARAIVIAPPGAPVPVKPPDP